MLLRENHPPVSGYFMKDWEGDKACRVVCHLVIAYRHRSKEMRAMALAVITQKYEGEEVQGKGKDEQP